MDASSLVPHVSGRAEIVVPFAQSLPPINAMAEAPRRPSVLDNLEGALTRIAEDPRGSPLPRPSPSRGRAGRFRRRAADCAPDFFGVSPACRYGRCRGVEHVDDGVRDGGECSDTAGLAGTLDTPGGLSWSAVVSGRGRLFERSAQAHPERGLGGADDDYPFRGSVRPSSTASSAGSSPRASPIFALLLVRWRKGHDRNPHYQSSYGREPRPVRAAHHL
jgi:hypothetical protein